MSLALDDLRVSRLLRTPSSERLLVREGRREIAVLDLHFLADGRVAGSLFVQEERGLGEKDVADLLAFLDTDFLPEASLAEGNLLFAVTCGRFLGGFEAAAGPPA